MRGRKTPALNSPDKVPQVGRFLNPLNPDFAQVGLGELTLGEIPLKVRQNRPGRTGRVGTKHQA